MTDPWEYLERMFILHNQEEATRERVLSKELPWQDLEAHKENRINKALDNNEVVNAIDKMYSEKFLERRFNECIVGRHDECDVVVKAITTMICGCECHKENLLKGK